MKKTFFHLFLFVFLTSTTACQNSFTKQTTPSPQDNPTPAVSEKFNIPEQINKPTVIMISIDGFRHDYLEKYKPPTLMKWAKQGVVAEGLIPSFPTLTFPNHVTLVTGLRPGHHGIVGNKFYDVTRKQFYAMGDNISTNDGSWYRGTPLWTAAEKEGMLSAICFWVGSEAKIGGIDPAYFKPYVGETPNEQRVTWVQEWLDLPENKRPHFIGLYFSSVDTAGHKFGIGSEELKKSVLQVDSKLALLHQFIQNKKLDVQIIVVSDHGMKNIEKVVELGSAISMKKFKTTGRGALSFLYTEDKSEVESTYQEIKKIPGPFQVFKASEYPARWALDDINRKGDLIVVGDPGVYISFADDFNAGKSAQPANLATHGWDTETTTDLNGLFIATGSKFKKKLQIKAFDNIHVYPLVTHILELKQDAKIDGDLKVLKPILNN